MDTDLPAPVRSANLGGEYAALIVKVDGAPVVFVDLAFVGTALARVLAVAAEWVSRGRYGFMPLDLP